ncbi:hypothetical protein HPB50_027369 [Hyalomma asiaticum]|uniref:Uncharacterized protein n=1 Tax=Hyalomma asiaticum TaxID=266040 RepID=A0ACB7TCQ5_HYAAI|nr:hypothetical protein HPB50_027369 [Hyalomma asiaticum]
MPTAQLTPKIEMATAAEIEPRKLKAIVAVLSIMVNDYMGKLGTLLQLMHRQRKLLHALAAIRQKKREKPTSLPRVPVNCCPAVRTLLLDYLHDEKLAFERHFRISRTTFRRISSIFARPRVSGWSRELELLIFLHWLAMGTSYRAIANTFGIPRSTIHGVVYRYVNNFANQLSMLIQPPQTEAKLRTVTEGFSRLCSSESFGAAAGVIDTCRITTSSGETSVLVQALCDSRGHFLDFSMGYPTSMDPADVFQASPLYEKASYPPQVVAICAMIHNLCVDENDVWFDPPDEVPLCIEPAGDFSWCVPGDEEMDDEEGLIARSNLAQAVLTENASCQVQLEHDYCGPEDESSPEEANENVMEVKAEDVAEVQEAVEVYTVEQQPGETEDGVMNQDYLVAAELTL